MVQDASPRTRIRAASHRCGEREFVLRCLEILEGTNLDFELLTVLGGNSTRSVLAGGEGGVDGHWPRVWALRALLYVWDPVAEPAVLSAGAEAHWRIREMAAKVVRANDIASRKSERLLEHLATDPNPRVRAAAERALR